MFCSWVALDRPVDCLRESDLSQIARSMKITEEEEAKTIRRLRYVYSYYCTALYSIFSMQLNHLYGISKGLLGGLHQFGILYGKVVTPCNGKQEEEDEDEETQIYLRGTFTTRDAIHVHCIYRID